MLQRLLKGLAARLNGAVGRFPETLALMAAFGAIAIYLNHEGGSSSIRETLERVLMTLVLGVLLTATLKLVCERWLTGIGYRLGALALSGLAMVAFYALIPDPITSLFSWRFGVTVISLMFAFSLVPFWGKDRLYPLGALKLISDGAVSVLYSIVLFAGGAAILFALEELLGVPVNSNWYGDYGILIGALFAPTHYLGSLVDSGDTIEAYGYSRVFKILIAYIIMPLLAIYTLILYLYFVRLPFIGGLPQGEVANLVMWYSAITLMVFFLSAPIKGELPIVDRFVKWMPYLMLMPLIMMFVAIGIRINAYGITVKRYFVVALGVWILINVLYRCWQQWRRRSVLDAALILSAVVVMLLSLYGPWSAYPMSIWHQNQRFEQLVTELGLWDGGAFVPNPKLTATNQQRIFDAINYFESQHSLSEIRLLPKGFNPQEDMVDTFGFEYTGYYHYPDNRRWFNVYASGQSAFVPTQGAQGVYLISWYTGNKTAEDSLLAKLGISIDPKGEITLKAAGGTQVVLPFGTWLQAHLEGLGKAGADTIELSETQMVLSKELEGKTYTFLLRGLGGYQEPGADRVFERIELLLLVE